MNKIHLYGTLAAKFGQSHSLAVDSAGEFIRAFSITREGFRDAFAEGDYVLVRGDGTEARLSPVEQEEAIRAAETHLTEETLFLGLGKASLHVIERIGGEGGHGTAKILMGVALVAGAWFMAPELLTFEGVGSISGTGMGASAFSLFGMSVSYGQIALIGGIMALTGVSELLTKKPKASYSSYTINQDNVTTQGGCVPVAYGGPIRVASTVISSMVENSSVSANGGIVAGGKNGSFAGGAGLFHQDQSTVDPNNLNIR